MFNVFSTALSALSAMSTAIDVTGNNLANMDTTGFKGSDMAFSDLISQSIGNGGGTSVGFGTAQPLTIQDFSQGAIQSETSPLDAAIQGSGFFIVQSPVNGNTTYTRDGTFQVDDSGNLTTQAGQDVQGWTAVNPNGSINTSGAIGNITLTSGALLPPVPTTQMTVSLNLNAASAADATSNFSTPVTVYDSLGTSHVLTVDFQNTGGNTWTYQVTIPGGDVTAGTAGTPFAIPNASGSLTFNSAGQLTSPAAGSPIDIAIPGLTDDAADLNVTWNPYTSGGAGMITQFGQASASSANTQNGSAASQLVSVAIANGGGVVASYSNGVQTTVGQLATAAIGNPNTLVSLGNNDYGLSAATDNPSVGTPGTGGRGTVEGSSLEASNVDLATQFTNLIQFQRSYEANAHVVTTADQLSQDTINLIH
jgi:flagellar hook protein FlgE